MTFKLYAVTALLSLSLMSVPTLAEAHGGRTAADGCHKDKKAGTRHCHGTKAKPKKYAPKTSY